MSSTKVQGLTDEEEEFLLRDIEENHCGLPNLGTGEYPTLNAVCLSVTVVNDAISLAQQQTQSS